MINTYNESHLHKELKDLFCPIGGDQEVPLLGSICDIFYDTNKIIEIQTANISSLRLKLEKFLPKYKVQIVYPIIVNGYIFTFDDDNKIISKRKSPKHGSFFQIFRELSGLYHLIDEKNLSFKILYIDCKIIKKYDKNHDKFKRNKNRPSIINKELINILKEENFINMKKLCDQVLNLLPMEFTNKDIQSLGAGKYYSYTSWFLKKTGLVTVDGKIGRCNKYIKIK